MMGMPLVAGRTFDDGSGTRKEVLISNSLAHQLWPHGGAVGHRFRNAVRSADGKLIPWQTVIGVVPDVVLNLVENARQPAIYRPLDDINGSDIALLVRMQGENRTERLQQFAASIQQGGSPPLIENVREDLDRTMAEPRFTMRVLATFAGLGVLLAAIGLFGLISYTVTQRTSEIGVRMALGATRGSIARLIVGDGIRLSLAGIGLGLLGAIAVTRLIQSLLYGVSHIDPFSFGVGALLLLAVSVIACVVPVLHATSVDPALAVRGE
jgi:putative ABC transport system permease protein